MLLDDASSPSDAMDLVVVGGGPASLSLVLRLLEPDAEMYGEGERMQRALQAKKLRPHSDVRSFISTLSKSKRKRMLTGKPQQPRLALDPLSHRQLCPLPEQPRRFRRWQLPPLHPPDWRL